MHRALRLAGAANRLRCAYSTRRLPGGSLSRSICSTALRSVFSSFPTLRQRDNDTIHDGHGTPDGSAFGPSEFELEDCVVKDEWPLVGRQVEAQMYSDVLGCYGVPDLRACSYSDPASDSEFREYCQAMGGMEEERVHCRLLFDAKFDACSVTEARGPHELLECVLHAMIGHWNLFNNGWLHRGVNMASTLLLYAPVPGREPVAGFNNISPPLGDCIGIIVDGTSGINWKDAGLMASQPWSVDDLRKLQDALPFWSLRRVRHGGQPQDFIQTAIDDLEGFLWVIIYAAFRVAYGHGTIAPIEKFWFLHLMADHTASPAKGHIPAGCGSSATSPVLAVFAPLFQEWHALAETARGDLERAMAHGPAPTVAFFQGYYGHYLRIGFKHLQDIPETWDALY